MYVYTHIYICMYVYIYIYIYIYVYMTPTFRTQDPSLRNFHEWTDSGGNTLTTQPLPMNLKSWTQG